MSRGPTTFTLILGLFFVALLLALSLAGTLSLRAALRTAGDTYGHLIAATAISADALNDSTDPTAKKTLDDMQRLGVHFSSDPPPISPVRSAPMLLELQHRIGEILEDPSRVAVAQFPEPQLWIRSQRDPSRWIVFNAALYRQQLMRSIILTAILAGLIALAVAAIGARMLTQPLERLAQNANAWIAGASIAPSLRKSPREVRSLAAAISNASARLRAATRDRELMLAGMSHDLRTPLARLRIALELGDADDATRRAAMIDDLEQLDSALEQCLAFVRDGRDESVRNLDIATLAAQLIGLRMQPDDWNLRSPDTLFLDGRPILLRRALSNLMDNAERYGKPPFDIVLSQNAKTVSVAIDDRGPGIDAALSDKLGQPFVRGDSARGGGGSGLGLSIVARIVELHGGALKWTNRDGGGFQVRIELPVEPAQSG